MGCYSCGGNPNTFCRECNYPKDTWIAPVDKLPDTFMGDFDHLFRTPDGNLYALAPERDRWIRVNGEAGKSVAYDDAELKRRLTQLEGRTDNFVSGIGVSREGSKVKLTYTFVDGTRKEVEFEDKDTKSIAYDDSALKSRISALETKTDRDTVYDDSSLKARVSALESKQDRDNQSLSFDNSTRALSISNGNSVTIPSDKQTIRKEGNRLVLSNNGGEIDLPTPKDSVPYDDTALRERITALEGRVDNDTVLRWSKVDISSGTVGTATIQKTSLVNPDGVKTGDIIQDYYSGNGGADTELYKVTSVNGNNVSVQKLGAWVLRNDKQTISKQGNKLILSNGGGEVELPTATTSAPYDDSALRNRITALENKPAPTKQRLSLSGNTLSLTDGGSVTLPQQASYNDTEVKARLTALEGRTDNDRQTLTLDNDTRRLSISNGNNVTLPNDRQSLTISGNTLSLSNGGGSVTLPQSNVSGFVTLEEYNKLKGALENILINLRASGAWRQTGSTIFEGNLYSGRNIATGNINIFSGSTDGGTYIRTNNGLTENDLAGGVS